MNIAALDERSSDRPGLRRNPNNGEKPWPDHLEPHPPPTKCSTASTCSGKRILVTGVSAGLGVETARALAAHGAQVVGAARDLDKAQAATEEVRAQAANGGGLELVELDLASLASVRACADALVAAGKPFDLVIANAGVMATPEGQDRRRLRDPVRHQPSRPLRVRQPDRLAVSKPGRGW